MATGHSIYYSLLVRSAVTAGVLFCLSLIMPTALGQPTIRSGSRGPDVAFAQQLLNEKLRPSPGLEVDGIFGPRTEQAARAFQRQANLAADGIIGTNTWNALLIGSGGVSYPLRVRPTADFHEGPRMFGALREQGTRAHAACDLIAEPGTAVLAVADGVVTAGPYLFYEGTYALEIRHADFVVRYAEVGQVPAAIRPGARVQRGQVIAYVIRNTSAARSSMLHLEMYKGTATGALTQRDNGTYDFVPDRPYERRRDLINPTYYLDRWPLPR